MNILFVSLLDFGDISEHGLYTDLLREFVKNDHHMTIVSPVERRNQGETRLIQHDKCTILKVRIGNIQKTNYFEKGISILLFNYQILKALKKFKLKNNYDLILYSTPPITIVETINKLKKETGAKTFLMLKDIWPQEIVDLGIISKKNPLYWFLNLCEKQLYRISDWIGCSSPANISYVLSHNNYINRDKVVRVNNSTDPQVPLQSFEERKAIRQKLGIPNDRILFFYGGNLGKPQDIPFIVKCLSMQTQCQDRFFLICGQGTEYEELSAFFENEHPQNMLLLSYLPKDEYDQLVKASDVGIVFLNHRFSVPNCPSRFYTYMEYAKPVLACTDCATDINRDIADGDFGWWCESTDPRKFVHLADTVCELGYESIKEMGIRSRKYLERYYTVDKDYQRIIECITGK